ncbi:MAG: hypothetical protein ACRELC_06300 [Gemmatimonadota bacterium]
MIRIGTGSNASAAAALALLGSISLGRPALSQVDPSVGNVEPGNAGGAAIPAGTELDVRLGQTLTTETSEAGDRWSGVLTHDVTDGERVLLREGATVSGIVTHAGPLEIEGETRQVISIEPKELLIGDRHYPIEAKVISAELHERDETLTGENLVIIGASTLGGALLGELLLDEALLGAVLGAAGGTVVAIATEETEIELQEGSTLTLRLEEDAQVTP